MGNYATIAQLKTRFENDEAVAHLTGDQDSGTPDNDLLTEALDAAEQELDSIIGAKYDTPVDVTTTGAAALMKSMTLDVAVCRLIVGRYVLPETVQVAYDRAIAWAERVRDGKAVLTSGQTEPSTVATAPAASYGRTDPDVATNRLFTRDSQDRL